MCSTPLIASSSGVPTVCASTVGLAPGYTARTVMVGGVTSGYSLIGSVRIAISPAARMTSDSTTAKIGRSMKKREKRTTDTPEYSNGDESAMAQCDDATAGCESDGGVMGTTVGLTFIPGRTRSRPLITTRRRA